MRGCSSFLVLVVLGALALPAQAQGLFAKRKAPTNPADQVQKLITAAQSAKEDKDRLEAVQGLREFDAVAYSGIVPVLINVLKTDKAVSVRIEAARSLGRIRPLTSSAGEALLEASLHDSALRVRWQARTSLTYYTVANVNPRAHSSAQPPGAAPPKVTDSKDGSTTAKAPGPGTVGPVLVPAPNSGKFNPPPSNSMGYSKPLPKGPLQPGTVPPSTNEPPLATQVPASPASSRVPASPQTGAPWVPAKTPNLPTVPVVPPPPPVAGPSSAPATTGPILNAPVEGPILSPPPR
jgi:hypothetical protein